MDVILLEKVENLGGIGDRVKVRSGYGRNFLLPKGKAKLATPENVQALEAMRAELEAKAAADLATAQSRAAKVAELQLSITAKAGTEGKLFGSVGTIDIAEACTRAGVEIERSEVRLADGPIRIAGEHQIELHLHSDITVPVTLTIVPEE